MGVYQIVEKGFNMMLTSRVKERGERFILIIAILSYLAHLSLILLAKQGIIEIDSSFFKNPIAAIYTPFSFILLYEVYLLIFFLPKSISYYIGKQYEIITLIVIRRIFKDISKLELESDWFQNQNDLLFTYDTLTSLVLFILLFLFYRQVRPNSPVTDSEPAQKNRPLVDFIFLKKAIAVLLVPILFLLATYTLFDWASATISDYQSGIRVFKNLNNIFFDEFFTILIIVDVLLLLASFFYSDRFHTIIRNSGFVISTILLKMSFGVEGIVNNLLIIGAVLFGYLILIIHDLFEERIPPKYSD